MSIPVVASTTYAYGLINQDVIYIQGSELNDRGDWMMIGSYVVADVVTYLGALYYCLSPNTGLPPTDNIDDNWTTLVEVESVTQSGTSGLYIRDLPNAVYAHHIYFGTGADQVHAGSLPYINATYTTVGAALDALLYTAIQITSFSNDQSVIEKGGQANNVALTWTLNKAPTSQSLNQGIGTLATTDRAYTQAGSFTTNRTYTLTASDGTTTTNGNSTVSFMQKRYWGPLATPSPSDVQIRALSNEFASSRAMSKVITAAGEYIFINYPASFGLASFTVNGLPNTAWTLSVQTFVNASGYSDSYNVYHSNNILTGTYTIVVS